MALSWAWEVKRISVRGMLLVTGKAGEEVCQVEGTAQAEAGV